MHRRAFLRLVAGAAVGAAVAPETLIAPVRTYFDLGAKPHFPGHTFVNPDWVVKEALATLKKNMGLSIRMSRSYDRAFDAAPNRFDILYGFRTVRPALACIVPGETVQVYQPVAARPNLPDAQLRFHADAIREAAKNLAAQIDRKALDAAYRQGVIPTGDPARWFVDPA
jgi:hypothetical protein